MPGECQTGGMWSRSAARRLTNWEPARGHVPIGRATLQLPAVGFEFLVA